MSHVASSPSMIMMLKAPLEGTVKTRLARDLGPAQATDAYRRLVEQQIRAIPADWDITIAYAPGDQGGMMQTWLGSKFRYFPQSEGDLGARLIAAMETHFARSGRPLVFVGGDCPYLTAEILRRVAVALEKTAVLIPALDGGYCLIGLPKRVPHVFREITWSSAVVAEETRQRLREKQLAWVEFDALEDVDDLASWRRAEEFLKAVPRK